uniref:Uncharacterized protein n=1 Tax=Cucumis melo TaxID=3656 RepID=A0A9I9CVG2_CUCME
RDGRDLASQTSTDGSRYATTWLCERWSDAADGVLNRTTATTGVGLGMFDVGRQRMLTEMRRSTNDGNDGLRSTPGGDRTNKAAATEWRRRTRKI